MIMMDYVDKLTLEVFEEILDFFPQKARYFYFAVQNIDDYSLLYEWMRENSEYTISEVAVSRWPGTGTDFSFSEKNDTIGIKVRITNESKESLLQSVLPKLLSRDYSLGYDIGCDISILQEDGHPWFITVRHEGYAYFLLHENEVAYACQIFDGRIEKYIHTGSLEHSYNQTY